MVVLCPSGTAHRSGDGVDGLAFHCCNEWCRPIWRIWAVGRHVARREYRWQRPCRALLTGWLLLTWLGTPGTLRFLVGLSAVFPLLAVPWPDSPLAVAMSDSRWLRLLCARRRDVTHAGELWARLHGTTRQAITFGEDHFGLSLLKARGTHPRWCRCLRQWPGPEPIPYGGKRRRCWERCRR